MYKKFIFWTLFIIFSAVLMIGGINRTSATPVYGQGLSNNTSNYEKIHFNGLSNQGNGHGKSNKDAPGFEESHIQNNGGQSNDVQNNDYGDKSTAQEPGFHGHGKGNQGKGAGHQGKYSPNQSSERLNVESGSDAYQWITLSGTVSSVDVNGLVINLESGQVIDILGRSWQYAKSMGFNPQTGDQFSLNGLNEGGKFNIAQIVDLTNGQSVQLRDDNGHPLWRGKQDTTDQ